MTRNRLFALSLSLLALFLFTESWIRELDLYRTFPSVDIPSHFIGGMATASTILWILSLTPIGERRILSIAFTFLVAVIWEIMETLQEMIIPDPPYLQDYFFWDGFWDIAVTVIGGVSVFGLLSFLDIKYDLPKQATPAQNHSTLTQNKNGRAGK